MKFDIKNLCIWKASTSYSTRMTENVVREIRDGYEIYPFYMAKQFVDMDIAELNLSVRAYNCLRRMGWSTIGDIVNGIESKQDLLRIHNLGKTSAEDIFIGLINCHQDLLAESEKNIYRNKYNSINGISCENKEEKTRISIDYGSREKQLEIAI